MRFLDPVKGLQARIAAHDAPLEIPDNVQEWRSWRRRSLRKLRRALGPLPDRVPLSAEVTETHDEGDYLRLRVVYDSEQFASVPAWLLEPKGMTRGERRPAILCAHGHGAGRDDPAGLGPHSGKNDYARRLARRGYICLVPDWRGFGERKAPAEWLRSYNDACDMLYLGYGYLGFELLTLDLWDGMRGIDYLQSLPSVDGSRIGMIGLSFGGTMTTFLAAVDRRVRCAVISGYLSTIADALSDRGRVNTCGSQFVRGLLTFGDIATAAGLIAPRPCLAEIGQKDRGFFPDDAKKSYAQVKRIYAAAGAKDKIAVDVHPGGHEFSGAKALDWLDRWLWPARPG